MCNNKGKIRPKARDQMALKKLEKNNEDRKKIVLKKLRERLFTRRLLYTEKFFLVFFNVELLLQTRELPCQSFVARCNKVLFSLIVLQ